MGVSTPNFFTKMEKDRAKEKEASQVSRFFVLLELLKAVLTGVARAVVSHWLERP